MGCVTSMGDATGETMADAMQHNASLQSLVFIAYVTNMGDTSGETMADAIKHTATLQTLVFDVYGTIVGNATGEAFSFFFTSDAPLVYVWKAALFYLRLGANRRASH